MTEKAMRQRIKQNVLEVDPTAEVWLYGSRARGTAREDSDWDILVLTSHSPVTTSEESRFVDHMCDVIVDTGEVVQLFAYGKDEWHQQHRITPFYQNVQHDAIRL